MCEPVVIVFQPAAAACFLFVSDLAMYWLVHSLPTGMLDISSLAH